MTAVHKFLYWFRVTFRFCVLLYRLRILCVSFTHSFCAYVAIVFVVLRFFPVYTGEEIDWKKCIEITGYFVSRGVDVKP